MSLRRCALRRRRCFRRIHAAVDEIKSSTYQKILLDGLDFSLGLVESSTLPEIICYGLGNFSQTRASKYQLAAILTIKSHYSSNVHLYDPLFFPKEIEILKRLDLRVIESNEEAKRCVGETLSLVYMPHCPYQLTNNLIYANWSPKHLKNCIVLSNSFKELVSKEFEESVNYLGKIYPYTFEIELKNTFEYEEVFNGSSIHVFRRANLASIPIAYWESKEIPTYCNNCEFVTRSQTEDSIDEET